MKKQGNVLVVDDDPCILDATVSIVARCGYRTCRANNGYKALEILKTDETIDLVLLDLKMPDMDGVEVLRHIRAGGFSCGVIIMTAHGDLGTAAETAAIGAQSFIEKPCFDELPDLIEGQLRARKLVENISLSLPSFGGEKHTFASRSEAMKSTFALIEKVVATDTTMLIEGESGTGKGILAEAVHHNSSRRNKRFVTLNCASIPKDLMESEMFGHEKGAFTGADARRIGKFEYAAGGTLFLDEIGEMPMDLQAKLLRVVQERVFERVGGNRTIQADVRIVAATNRDLRKLLGITFREDLFWRLNVINIQLPPLRERPEDIAGLCELFVSEAAARHGRNIKGMTSMARQMLMRYSWPGNIRELKNAVEYAVLLETGEWLQPVSFPAAILSSFASKLKDSHKEGGNEEGLDKDGCNKEGGGKEGLDKEERDKDGGNKEGGGNERRDKNVATISSGLRGYDVYFRGDEDDLPALEEAMMNYEAALIARALDLTDGNVSLAAQRLSIELRTLQRRIKKYKEAGLLK